MYNVVLLCVEDSVIKWKYMEIVTCFLDPFLMPIL